MKFGCDIVIDDLHGLFQWSPCPFLLTILNGIKEPNACVIHLHFVYRDINFHGEGYDFQHVTIVTPSMNQD